MITIRDAAFRIAAKNIPAAFAAVQEWGRQVVDSEFRYWMPLTVLQSPSLEVFMEELGYGIGIEDESGDIADLYTWEDIDYGGEEFLFAALAPFVESGSYIDLQIDNEFFRWEFNGQYMLEFVGEVCYVSHAVIRPTDFVTYVDNLDFGDVSDLT
jgi:hypothetical protein